ncbi:hypothetical protein ACWOFR_01165 [Carnobacterium gallinarum]|uniref:hypothetical protein n=1 Tax=Carnobacterium gallinarum TaxID=2749 RepID=UPI000A00A7D2|nr:hypothetical protein [Carnobacterium gallinarum]
MEDFIILKSAKLAQHSNKAFDAVKLTEKEWNALKVLDKSSNAIKIEKKLVIVGDDMGKMGKLISHPNITVDWSLYAEHGLESLNKRGMSEELVESIVKNGKSLEQAGGNKCAFITKDGVVVISKEGKLVTAWSNDYFDGPMNELIIKLFGE